MSTQYPEDEFDVAGRERAPEGVHRRPRSPLATWLPFLLVLVLVPLLAWGAVSLLSREPAPEAAGTPTATQEPTATAAPTDGATTPDGATAAPTGEATDEPTGEEPTEEEPTDEETAEPEPAADVSLGASISVLNGAGVGGLAATAAEQLTADGFTNVIAADYTAGSPDVTTLYYRNAELAPTAQRIGDVLGIGNLVELASATENVEIAIVLREDYAP